MLFTNPRKLLSEAASADLLTPEVSDEVKNVIDELEEDLVDQNIEEVKDSDKTTNGGIPVTTESASLMEAGNMYGEAKYLITLETVMAIKETEGEAAAMEANPGEAPAPAEIEAAEPHAANVIEDIAARNGVEPEQVAVTINAESVRFLAETAILEAKADREPKAYRKLCKIKETVEELKGHVKLVKT